MEPSRSTDVRDISSVLARPKSISGLRSEASVTAKSFVPFKSPTTSSPAYFCSIEMRLVGCAVRKHFCQMRLHRPSPRASNLLKYILHYTCKSLPRCPTVVQRLLTQPYQKTASGLSVGRPEVLVSFVSRHLCRGLLASEPASCDCVNI